MNWTSQMAVVRYRYSWHATSEPIITTRTSRMTSKATLATNMDDTECKEGDRLSLSIGRRRKGCWTNFWQVSLRRDCVFGHRWRTRPFLFWSVPLILMDFLHAETYHMIDTCDPSIAAWSCQGDSFIIKDVDAFSKVSTCLPSLSDMAHILNMTACSYLNHR